MPTMSLFKNRCCYRQRRKTINSRSRNHNRSRGGNQPVNRSLKSFTGEVPSVGSELGTVAEHRIMNDPFKTFQKKVKQYVLRKFDNTRYIIVVVWDLKELYAQVHMDKHIKHSKEYNEYIILVTQLQEEAKNYVNRLRVLNNKVPKIYGILWGKFTPGFHNEVQGDPYYDKK